MKTKQRLLGPTSSLLAATLLSACSPSSTEPGAFDTCANPTAACVLGNGMSLQTREPPKVMTPISVTVRDVPISVTSVHLEASMIGMEMPPVVIALKGSGPSEWSGQLILPICSQGRSDWVWSLVTREGSGTRRTGVRVEATY